MLSLFLCTTAVAAAQTNGDHDHEQQMSAATCINDPSIPFSHYGYRHCELHQYGTIDALLAKTDSNCCDGGRGGECRVTTFSRIDGAWYAQIDGLTCPVSVQVHFDIPMPTNVQGVICAPGAYGKPMVVCPKTYCAAVAPGL